MSGRAIRGRKAHRRGHRGEYIALIHLMLTGHRILGFRLKTPHGEIDILALKRRRLIVVEVKHRRTLTEALEAVGPIQRERLWQAGLRLQAKRANLAGLDLSLDLYVLSPGRLPRHVVNAFEGADPIQTGSLTR